MTDEPVEDWSDYGDENWDGYKPAAAAMPALLPAPPEGGYGERFFNEMGSIDGLSDTITGIPSGVWGAMKGAYGVASSPIDSTNSYLDNNFKNGALSGISKTAGDVGKIASRINPAFFLTGPAYDKLLSNIDPDNFPPTTPEQDAAKIRGEVIMGAAPIAGLTALKETAKGVGATGGYLRGKLADTVIPERVKTFDETLTPGMLNKSMRAGDSEIGRIEQAAARNRGIVDQSPVQAYREYVEKKRAAGRELGRITRDADPLDPTVPAHIQESTRVQPGSDTGIFNPSEGKNYFTPDETITTKTNVPDQYSIDTPIADNLIAKWDVPEERALLAEKLAEKKTALEVDFEGSVKKLQNRKTAAQRAASELYTKEGGAKTPMEQRLDAAFADDLRNTVKGSIKDPLAYDAASMNYADMKAIGPVVRQRLNAEKLGRNTIPEQTITAPWGKNVDTLAKFLLPSLGLASGGGLGGLAGIAASQGGGISSLLGKSAGTIGRMSNVIGDGAGAARNALVNTNISGPIPQALLPRDTARFSADQMENFMLQTASRPEATVAQGLVSKLGKAMQAQDMDTVEKIHSDMARLFPDLFEKGLGVNGKLFYPDEQAKVMDNLKQLNRLGQVSTLQLAKQQNSFNNPQDSRILPMDQLMTPNSGGASRFNNGVRVFDY